MDDSNPISCIFHEKQEGSLCAQHCLNALLQANIFTPVDLADIARELDEAERQRMAEAGTNSAEYQRFVQQPSNNFDDSGFFSIQVIQKAVQVWNLKLIPFTSSEEVAHMAREDARSQQAYICNFREHWFTIRKLGNQWFNLNSLLTFPELVSDTYLSLLLTQLQQEGYSIFIVVGQFPVSEADQILKVVEAVQPVKPRLLTERAPKADSEPAAGRQFVDEDLARALEESRRFEEEGDQSLMRALAMSRQDVPADFAFPLERLLQEQSVEAAGSSSNAETSEPTSQSEQPTTDELRNKRLAFYTKDSESSTAGESTSQNPAKLPSEQNEEDMLELALKMSMEEGT